MALPRQMPRLCPRHVPRFCPWQTPWYQPSQPTEVRGNCHGNLRGRQTTAISTAVRGHLRPLPRQSSDTWQLPRKAAAITTAISADVKSQQFPRPSAAIRGHCHGNPPIRGNYHGSPRQLPRQFPRTSNHSNFHGHSRQLSRQSSDARQLPRKSAAIPTAISADVKP